MSLSYSSSVLEFYNNAIESCKMRPIILGNISTLREIESTKMFAKFMKQLSLECEKIRSTERFRISQSVVCYQEAMEEINVLIGKPPPKKAMAAL